jgi:DNA (cytosine-5)-methyltransferase 1
MTAAGQCWELPMSGRRTSATGSGLWATPSASDSTRGGTITDSMTGISLVQQMNTPHRWPTPTTQDNAQVRGVGAAANASRRGTTLGGAVRLWPTPQASDNRPRGTQNSTARRMALGKQVGLEAMIKWSTPTVQDSKNNGAKSQMERNSLPLNAQVGGSLNPTWVEWLMGWPIGHTDLKPLATDKFQQWQQQHGVC